MVEKFNQSGASQIMVEAVAKQDVSKFGIVDINGSQLSPGQSADMIGTVEKPNVEEAPSNLAVVGRYVLSAQIWQELARTPPGADDEIQLTDAIASLMQKETTQAYYMVGKSHDCGSKFGYMKAIVEFGLRHPEIKDRFVRYLSELNLSDLN